MSILVNFSSVLAQPTGLATYSLNLIKELKSLDIDIVGSAQIAGYRFHPAPHDLTAAYGLKGHLKRLLWVQFQLPKLYHQLASSLLFSPIPEAPLTTNCRWVVTVHDLIPLRFSRHFAPATIYNRYYIPQVLTQAVHIICNSNATTNDIVQFYGIPAHKITPIPLAHDAENFRFLNLPTQNYFLYLGRINPYKNVQRLIAAFARMPNHKNYELWIAGPPDDRYLPGIKVQLEQLNVVNQIKFLNYVPYSELPKLINQAIALVFPSLWEGFGLPILETMACGTPVITSNLASLPEVAGDAAILVDPYDVDAISRAMTNLTIDPHLSAQLRTAGLARANQFSWAKTGQATVQVLQKYA